MYQVTAKFFASDPDGDRIETFEIKASSNEEAQDNFFYEHDPAIWGILEVQELSN